MGKPIKCFIVEGVDRDYRFLNEMLNTFCKGKYGSITICLPAEQNIYMLYNKLKEDDFETDIVELLRESNAIAMEQLDGVDRQAIDEVYLFFDFDIHYDNLRNKSESLSMLYEMLRYYDNETDNGKLYVSYPMVEALYDYRVELCEPFSNCFVSTYDSRRYKELSGHDNPNSSKHPMTYDDWSEILMIFVLRIRCLFEMERIDCSIYRKEVSPVNILRHQERNLEESDNLFVLSAFPEFLFDYFREDFWNAHAKRNKYKFLNCPKGRKNV